jgi:hypothetical protein
MNIPFNKGFVALLKKIGALCGNPAIIQTRSFPSLLKIGMAFS